MAFPQQKDALPVELFVDELKGILQRHAIDPTLAQKLKYGGASPDGLIRWAKDYFHYIRHDVQATAATLARCQDRSLFLLLAQNLSRKAGFYQVKNPLDLYHQFAAGLGIDRDALENHYPCAETLGALFTKRTFQFWDFEEGFTAYSLCSEGAIHEVVRDQQPFLCQKGLAEYMKRAYNLTDAAVEYWHVYEDFGSLDGQGAWEILPRLATDASLQERIRRTLLHSIMIYQCMRRAWSQIVTDEYWDAEIIWPPRSSAAAGG